MLSTTNEKSTKWNTLTLSEKLSYVRKHITVEPILACYIVPSVLASLATQNLNLEKACRVNLAYSDDVCDALTRRETANYTNEEKMVQQLVAGMAAWKTVLQSALPCMLILFYGSWSDRHGRRKPCMLIPILGELIAALGLMLCTYFENTPMEAAGVTEALFPGLTGGWFTMLMGVFSYVADVTSEEDRTLRIGIVNLCFSLGVPIGMAFSGVLLKQIGFYGVFGISASLYLIAFLYGLIFVPEPVSLKKQKELNKQNAPHKSMIADFFDRKHVVETFEVAFKRGANQRRLRVIMLMIVVMVVIGPMHGEMSVVYLFTRYQFNWSEVEFSFFSTYGMLTGLIGTVFSVGVFSHLLKIDDALIGVMSSMSKILSSFVYAFAVTEWQLYLAPLVEILNGTSFIAMRSIATKLVQSDELGKVNSLFGVAEALMPLVYAPMYASLYQATIETLPGAFFLVGGLLTAPAVIIFLWMYKMNKRDLQLKANDLNNVNCIKIPPKKSFEENGVDNPTFISDDILDQTIEIVKEFPLSRKGKL
ncbi:Solute carrier family 46 member 3 [Pseudolycoriella hygida]|uniref:Solute carrier family 46 member 3 n=1 Tax=Pseudolycoriella hygida TaxID=35572 RepID=A0A9Q0N3W5_9DIPT|nr:Solute carrier family 46 member 3 [Pseudolycoriella hygida]